MVVNTETAFDVSAADDGQAADDGAASAVASLEHESDDLWKQYPAVAWLTLTAPLWISALVLAGVTIWRGAETARLVVLATLTATAAGRFIIWGGGDSTVGLTALELAGVMLCMDFMCAVLLTWHAGFLFHIPWVGPRLRAAVREGTAMLKQKPWMRRLTTLAVLMFVMLPISSTGSIGGSLLGRLLGMSRAATFAVVILGSVLGCSVMLLGAELLEPLMESAGPGVRYAGLAVVVGIGVILSRRYLSTLQGQQVDPGSMDCQQ